MSKPSAAALKEEGNRHFQKEDYVGAEALYSKAIVADPKEPTFYTNRAMARLKMLLWDRAIEDCNACLTLTPANMKAHFYLAQAHLALRNVEDALTHARRAHALCVEQASRSLESITQLVLRCKKERWEDREKRRRREWQQLEMEMLEMLERERDAAARDAVRDAMETDTAAGGGDAAEIQAEWEQKLEDARQVFEKARADSDKRRKVPQWAICDISFEIFVDPVVTRSGKSYERASILEHLRRQAADGKQQTDPLTREPLSVHDLRPNLALKQACEEFLEENGWAVDW